MFGEGTNPIPYIAGAYGVAVTLLGVYIAYQWRLRQRLLALAEATQDTVPR